MLNMDGAFPWRRPRRHVTIARSSLIPRPVTSARSSSPLVHLDGSMSSELAQLLRDTLPAQGLLVGDSQPSAVSFVALEQLLTAAAQPAGSHPAVALFDGLMRPELAPLFRRPVPPLLLGCRAPDGGPLPWELRAVTALLTSRSLLPQPATSYKVGSLEDVRKVSALAAEAVLAHDGSKSAADIATDVMHELSVNALLDAPVDGSGKPKYAHVRDQAVSFDPKDACEVAIAVEDGRIYLSALDLFGRLTAEPLARALERYQERAKVNESGGGAGLGFRRLVEHSDLLAVRVSPGRACQAVSVVDLGPARRRTNQAKSVMYYVDRG